MATTINVTASDSYMIAFLVREVFRSGGYDEAGLYAAVADYLDCDETTARQVLVDGKWDRVITLILREQSPAADPGH